ncbi:hypothetical protein EDD16DRAFT_988381 [Pisolithus croceorrhizus]|nr:hypothetical protein EDD16DRAFT_988381 [Pisolithus croceorrhizus]
MCHMLYYYLIINYGNPMSLEYIVWSFSASVLVNSLVITIVQSFFAHKIYHICRRQLRWLVVSPIILLILVGFGFGTGTVVVILVNNALSFDFLSRVALLTGKLVMHTRYISRTPPADPVTLNYIPI